MLDILFIYLFLKNGVQALDFYNLCQGTLKLFERIVMTLIRHFGYDKHTISIEV